MPIEKSAGALIFRKEKDTKRYLLLHYESGHWEFVKGHIEKGESIKDTVRREAKEEAGIDDLEFIEGFKETVKYFFKWPPRRGKFKTGQKSKNIMKFVTFLLAETKTENIKLSHEHIGYEWLPYEQAFGKLTFKNAKELLKKAREFLIKHEIYHP